MLEDAIARKAIFLIYHLAKLLVFDFFPKVDSKHISTGEGHLWQYRKVNLCHRFVNLSVHLFIESVDFLFKVPAILDNDVIIEIKAMRPGMATDSRAILWRDRQAAGHVTDRSAVNSLLI